ncbi:MAG TPA: AMP-binding protein [Solirubrobacterales bacterium]|nr:AMP-binding protein [Solirubrobacterales bacterium]
MSEREAVQWTTDAILARAVAEGPERVAIVSDGASLTYGELDAGANRVGQMLAELRVGRGERVAVLMANRPEYLVLYHGIGRYGACLVPIVTQSKPPEIGYFVEHSEATVLVVDEERWEVVRDHLGDPELASIKHVIKLGDAAPGAESYETLMLGCGAERVDYVPTEEEWVALMYTSGSTGRPKAVIHPHYTAVAQAEAVAERMGYTADDRLMTIFPLFHGNALVWSALTAVWAGARVIITERFSASRFWDQARAHGATEVNLLVGAINMILAQPPRPDDRDHPVRTSVANVTKTVYDAFTERFGVDIVSTWALAEGPLGTMTAPGHPYRPGEIGWPLGHDNEIRVFDPDDNEVGPGVTGELVQRNKAMMPGYFKNEEETARVLRNGWVHSGDLGYRDEEGAFYFVGREKHVIRRSGENVSGEEVEETLQQHPAVDTVAVIAVPDDIRGEEVKAYIVTAKGAEVEPEELIAWCEERLADFKVPRYIEFIEELPRTGPMKVNRPELARRPGLTDCWDRRAHGAAEQARS